MTVLYGSGLESRQPAPDGRRQSPGAVFWAVLFGSILLNICATAHGTLPEPLYDAAERGDLSEVKRLVAEGIDANVRGTIGCTALLHAASKGHTSVAEFLIRKGADVNAKNELGLTALHYGADGGHDALVEMLIRMGADIDARERLGATPLHHAATMGHTSVAELLIRNSAEVDARNKRDFTPLHGAALMGNAAVAELLIRRGAEVNARAEDGWTPLHVAAQNGHLNVVKLLIRMGADVTAKNRDEETPLNWAANKGHKRVAELLRAQQISGCEMADLSISANIPEGYTHIPTKCPKVAYKKNLTPKHALGFYIVETWDPHDSSSKKSVAETLDDYMVILQSGFNKAYKGQSYNTFRIDESADYPPSLLEHGGACGGLVARTPEFYKGVEGVEWRRGIACLVELPPTGSEKWTMFQAFYFDKNLERTDYKPTADFKQVARRLFRSLRIKGTE
jgi:ankyrin repeat protein